MVAKSAIPAVLVDKENVPLVPRVPALGSLTTVDRFSDSSDMEMDSSPSEPEAIKSEWRVPPLAQHQPEAVDIFSAPEYSEVRLFI